MKTLYADVRSMESAKDRAFTLPPRAWIASCLAKLNALLAKRTEQSALALRRLTGNVPAHRRCAPCAPTSPHSKFQGLNLLVEEGSN